MIDSLDPALVQISRQFATLLSTSSPVAGDPTWGLRRRLLLDEERTQVVFLDALLRWTLSPLGSNV